MTDKAIEEIKESLKRDKRMWEILSIIVAEWDSDPLSVQCFDLRIVGEAKKILAQHKKAPKYLLEQ